MRGNRRSGPATTRRPPHWRFFTGPVFVGLFVLSLYELSFTWPAHEGHGRAGTWTATFVENGEGDLSSGRFVSDDGAEVREHVRLEHPDASLHVGESVRAIDVGRPRVLVLGGQEWKQSAELAVFSGLVSLAWLLTVPLAPLTQLAIYPWMVRREAKRPQHAPGERYSTPEARLAEIQTTADEADGKLDALLERLHGGLLEPEEEEASSGTDHRAEEQPA